MQLNVFNTPTDTTAPTLEKVEVGQDLTHSKGSSSLIRSAVLSDANGEMRRLDEVMGQGKSVVIFLRHLGWPYCWSYAKEWCALQQELDEADIAGPIFISIGDAEKLDTFLELNPFIPRDRAFVDDYSFGAYEAVGFGKFSDVKDEEVLKSYKPTAPGLTLGEFWKYLTNAGKLSPIPKDAKFGDFPEGVLMVGGTFVVNGQDIIYQWNDQIPGNHPVVNDVVEVAKNAPVAKEEKKKGFFPWL